MRDLGTTYAHIPARAGSKRVPAKNLRLLNGKPLIAYAIKCAKDCNDFDDIFVNTDSEAIGALAEQMGVRYFQRDAHLASDEASGDDFTADFMEKMKPDTLVMISPVCPLVEPSDVSKAIDLYRRSDCDTLITCDATQLQTFCEDEPVNISLDGPLAPSQDNPEVRILNWAVTIWDCKAFLASYVKSKNGYIGSNRVLMPIDPLKTVKISKDEDFRLAEALMIAKDARGAGNQSPVEYWKPGNPVS